MEAEATHIPSGVEVDVEGMEIGTPVHAGDLKLPAGTTLAADPDVLVLHVIAAPTAEQLEAELGSSRPRPRVPRRPPSPDAPDAAGGRGLRVRGLRPSGWRAGPAAGRGLAPG